MRIRTVVAALGIALGATVAGAGSASAIQPIINPGNGVYAGFALDEGETVALNNSPIPVVLDRIVGDRAIFRFSSETHQPFTDYEMYLPVSDVIRDAAGRGGLFALVWIDPAQNFGQPFRVIELV
ncbi:hypothetical protein [Nocardia yamanashiensis]|uniref:hypothetical protein n=1 Tax=Nocardia yamanashiensis TaxID=209247 RepID=UPI000ACFB1B7|nr:hypothetical protein [Nocardia yamanashiensis]